MADDLPTEFQAAVAASRQLTQRPDNKTLLKIYALYKQATEGDITQTKPGFSDMIGRAKWDAWNMMKSHSREDAMQRYVELIRSLS